MGQNPVLAPSEPFILALRSALNHLYDPDVLRLNPLVKIFGVDNRFDTPSALQNILTKAIESLKPRPGAPNRAHLQAVYDLLLYRYVQQITQDEIASQLGISVRHMRRQQRLAVYELASTLWEQHNLGAHAHIHEILASSIDAPETQTQGAAAFGLGAKPPGGMEVDEVAVGDATPGEKHRDAEPVMAAAEPDHSGLTRELEWLQNAQYAWKTDMSFAIPEALQLIRPLCEQNGALIQVPEDMAGLLIAHPVAFQQILLSLLSIAVRVCGSNAVALEIIARPGQHEIRATGVRSFRYTLEVDEEQAMLETLRRLVYLSQGVFAFQPSPTHFQAGVCFRSIDPIPVLAIDDNTEIITMMQRFAAETIYQIIGIHDPRSAIDQALKVLPKMIVLDIMMPQVDGLQLLSRIKHHPALVHIPVIVCSVLPQKDLAESLGASAFLSKPIQRDPFISVLDALYARLTTEGLP
jgi:CheY-like chemotaxis protein